MAAKVANQSVWSLPDEPYWPFFPWHFSRWGESSAVRAGQTDKQTSRYLASSSLLESIACCCRSAASLMGWIPISFIVSSFNNILNNLSISSALQREPCINPRDKIWIITTASQENLTSSRLQFLRVAAAFRHEKITHIICTAKFHYNKTQSKLWNSQENPKH